MQNRRVVGLDVFRVLAVFIVFLFHSQLFVKCEFGFCDNFVRMGAVFMTGFFMLSGFVLHLTYSGKNLVQISNLKNFYLKRLIGILPVYYFSSIVYILLLGKESLKENLLLAPIEILGLQSTFSTLFKVSHNDGTWFISCLLICYFAFPFFQEVSKQIHARTKIIAIILCVLVLSWAPVIVHFFRTESIYENPFFRCLEFLIGVLLCSLRNDETARKLEFLQRWKFFFVEFALFFVAISLGVWKGIAVCNFPVYNFIVVPASIAMIWSLSGVKSEFLANSKALQFACKISYVFFLAQTFCWFFAFKFQELTGIHSGFLNFAISFATCTLISAFTHLAVERPVSRYLQRKLIKCC